MRHWDEVREVLGDEFAVLQVEGEVRGERLLLLLADQTVIVELAGASAELTLTALAPILPERELVRPREALKLSGGLAVGALAVVEGVLVLRWTSALRPLTRTAVDRAVRCLAREATRLREIERHLVAPQALDLLVG
jgi:hypothetical protein